MAKTSKILKPSKTSRQSSCDSATMAHQAHNIPWDLLASNLHWCPGGPCHNAIHDLYPRYKPDQGKELTHFARAFAKNIEEHSQCERKKYPAKYDPPKSTDVIIEEKTAAKISPLLGSWRESQRGNYLWADDFACSGDICGHYDKNLKTCRCPLLPHEQRMASAFCKPYDAAPCYRFLDFHRDAYYNLQVLKIMILYGEIDPILRVCAHPEVAIGTWWDVDECGCGVSNTRSYI